MNYKNLLKIFLKNKDIVCSTRIPLGSKAFEMLNTASVILSSKEYLIFHDNLLQNNKQNKISQIIIQSYVHNTRGYCNSVIQTITNFLNKKIKKAFF